MRVATRISLTTDERDILELWLRRRKIARSVAQRADISLRAASGDNNCKIANAVDVTRQTVRMWR